MLKERHSTAKKLRKYYLQCLKQLLEEDRVALEGSKSPISAEDKLNRMAEALKTLSPDKEPTGKRSRLVKQRSSQVNLAILTDENYGSRLK